MQHTSSLRRFTTGAVVAAVLLGATACAEDAANDVATDNAALSEAPDGTFAGRKAEGTPVKIGIINAEDGPAISQPEGRIAAEAAIAYANEHLGGISGRPIEAVICKSKEDATSAAGCANQMVEAGVAGVVVLNSGQGDAMAPIITKAGISYTGYNGAAGSELTGDPAFFWTGGFPGILTGMAGYAAKNGYKSFTLFVTDNTAVVAGAKAMGEPAFKAAGVDIAVTPIPLGTPDATSQVAAGLKGEPGAVGVVGDATMCTSTLKGLGTVGYQGDKLLITPCLDSSTVEAAGDVMDGAKLMTSTDASGDHAESRLYRAVMAKYAPGQKTEGAAQSGFQSMFGFIRAVAGLKGEPTKDAIAAALRTAKDVPVPLAHGATMTCDGKAIPGLPAPCANFVLVGDLDAKGTPSNVDLLG
ncbi:amino acid/amide ABC transporter substrate-binding protein (HAAT family) [Actinocorallia herbida]|uniref:Amino acid/amide ABC transporter substrate-binding protein (HAAT family) n=1 Tax=Actinocorallia herbida TaxID=58109 RepID=A0A3N1D485_9ACTN|nr:ABC transporter substrate-binding protein [Actinocorallia herbida]ROO87888.1 amino acid/amide ABC transporter substrate-binding protein (HAAT family) [Actinocorallia herbida]